MDCDSRAAGPSPEALPGMLTAGTEWLPGLPEQGANRASPAGGAGRVVARSPGVTLGE